MNAAVVDHFVEDRIVGILSSHLKWLEKCKVTGLRAATIIKCSGEVKH